MNPIAKSLPALIKWPGSKRAVAVQLAQLFPTGGRYFEPFLGGGSVLGTQASRDSFAGDVVPELVSIWEAVRLTPLEVAQEYELRWNRLQEEGHLAFYDIRTTFNQSRSPHDLLFLSRTCVNGLIRFNRSGEFNNSLHHTRKGIHPDRFRKIVLQWSLVLANTTFTAGDYEHLLRLAEKGDVAFLDPPYVGTKGRYHPTTFDFDRLWAVLDQLNTRGVSWVLTLDGTAGARDYGTDWVPKELYRRQMAVATGNSPFSRVMESRVDAVEESVFLNFDPAIAGG